MNFKDRSLHMQFKPKMSMQLDRRFFAYREDLADKALQKITKAQNYTSPKKGIIIIDEARLLRHGDAFAPIDSTLLFGELLFVYEQKNGYSWVQSRRDYYVGYVENKALAITTKDHHDENDFLVLSACYLYDTPSIKAKPVMRLSMGAQITRLKALEDGHWWEFTLNDKIAYGEARHFIPYGAWQNDPAGLCESLVNFPYLWGGNGYNGYDCSGILAVAFFLCGHIIGRDSDIQKQMGEEIAVNTPLKRNDLIFWQGHVGIMLDEENLLHANATDMCVSVWPLQTAITKFKTEQDLTLIARRRLLPS